MRAFSRPTFYWLIHPYVTVTCESMKYRFVFSYPGIYFFQRQDDPSVYDQRDNRQSAAGGGETLSGRHRAFSEE